MTEEKMLLLVNTEHPLPEDYHFEIANLSCGVPVDAEIRGALEAMLDDCRAAGGEPRVSTAYRDMQLQTEIFEKRTQMNMELGLSREEAIKKTATLVAWPGCSEHHTGLAVDILSEDRDLPNDQFGTTPEGKWLAANCARYGFILRYPADKTAVTGIIYEPWHFRYVGTVHAEQMMASGLCLEEYVERISAK